MHQEGDTVRVVYLLSVYLYSGHMCKKIAVTFFDETVVMQHKSRVCTVAETLW